MIAGGFSFSIGSGSDDARMKLEGPRDLRRLRLERRFQALMVKHYTLPEVATLAVGIPIGMATNGKAQVLLSLTRAVSTIWPLGHSHSLPKIM